MQQKCPSEHSTDSTFSKYGSFIRRSDGRRIKRFRCNSCKKTFSQATFQSCYQQRKRRINPRVYELQCSGVSQRRIAKILKVSRRTVARKLIFLGKIKRAENKKQLKNFPPVQEMQFDDLETIEHTKCKPLSVIMAVDQKTRFILGFKVSSMPAKGLLAKKAQKKYGYRPDHRYLGRAELFSEIKNHISPFAEITSDESPHYPRDVKKYFPKAQHVRVKGARGCVAGQGELKKLGFDPLFSLNHSFAMLRANINRLFRKTWCTTKDPERLKDHIEIYMNYHNKYLIQKPVA